MPLLKHAKKKQRQDKSRTVRNAKLEKLFKDLVKKAKAAPSTESVSAAFKQIDKAAKHHIIHENKAARLKSQISKTATTGAAQASAPKTKKATKAKVLANKTAAKAAKAKNAAKKK